MITSYHPSDFFNTTFSYNALETNGFSDEVTFRNRFEQDPEIDKLAEPNYFKGTLKKSNKHYTIEIKDFPDPLIEQIRSSIHAIKLPKKWVLEGIKPPNFLSKELAEKIAIYIYNRFQLFPNRVSASIEEGVFLYYKNFHKEKELSLEVYNDLEISGIINQSNNILKTFDIKFKDHEIFNQIFKSFYE